MKNIKVGDFIILLVEHNNIKRNSIGLVRDMEDNILTIFFVGHGIELKVDLDDVDTIDFKKTGKPYDKKVCNVCHILKDMTEFDINQTDAKGRKTTRPSCKVCRVAIDGAPLLPIERKKMTAKTPKGIFTCPICTKTSIVGITANLVKDHDHVTGKARDWICDSCNTGLGRFKDNVELLQVAIEYLKKHNAHEFGDTP